MFCHRIGVSYRIENTEVAFDFSPATGESHSRIVDTAIFDPTAYAREVWFRNNVFIFQKNGDECEGPDTNQNDSVVPPFLPV